MWNRHLILNTKCAMKSGCCIYPQKWDTTRMCYQPRFETQHSCWYVTDVKGTPWCPISSWSGQIHAQNSWSRPVRAWLNIIHRSSGRIRAPHQVICPIIQTDKPTPRKLFDFYRTKEGFWPDFAHFKHDFTRDFYRSSCSSFISKCLRTRKFRGVWIRACPHVICPLIQTNSNALKRMWITQFPFFYFRGPWPTKHTSNW